MMKTTLDFKIIDTLRDLPNMIPVFRDLYEDWTIKVFKGKQHESANHLSAPRREFFKILFISQGSGVFTIGLNTYYIEEPTLLFIHPNDIISWKNLSEESGGHYILFRKSFVNAHLQLRNLMDKYALFSDKSKSVIRVKQTARETISHYFELMKIEARKDGYYREESIQAYLQLLMIEGMKISNFPKPDIVKGDYGHVYHFFNLLEKETSGINYNTPIRIKTAKEFANNLAMHPNYLNALLKKHTGQNASTHIRNRILEEAKILLLQTDWTLQDISFSIGFAEQPNFNQFFKKNTGFTPAEFRRTRLQ